MPPFCFFNINCQNSACFRPYSSASRQNERFCKLFSYQVSSSFISCACNPAGLSGSAQSVFVLNKGVACEPPVPCRAVSVTSCEYGVGDGFFPGCSWCSARSIHSGSPVDVWCFFAWWRVGSRSLFGSDIGCPSWPWRYIRREGWFLLPRSGVGISGQHDVAQGSRRACA